MMMKQKSSRLNIGDDVRELKLGCTFNSKNTTNAFHTIKYDFKPASVDKNRVATVDVGSNNQVTVTVPNLVSSGVPHTIYKGNQKKYTKECILIYDKRTGDITLEKLNHNIQVKKTREMTNKPSVPIPSSMPAVGGGSVSASSTASASTTGPAPKLENSTMRITSKTKVSTGNRKNTIIELKSRNSPMQGSPSAVVNRSPQSAPAWNANNGQATLPSIPMIVDDDDSMFSIGGGGSGGGAAAGGGGGGGGGGSGSYNNLANVSASSSSSTSSHHNNSGQEFDFQQLLQDDISPPTKQSKQSSHHSNQKRHNNHQRQQQQQQQQQSSQTQQLHQWQQNLQHTQQQQQQQQQNQQTQNPYNRYNGNGNSSSSSSLFSNNHSNNLQNSNHNNSNNYHNNYDLASSPTLASEAAALEQNIASDLSSSSSSSDSESSGSESGSDSDDSTEDDRPTKAAAAQMMNQLPNLGMAPLTTTSSSPQMHYNPQTSNSHHHNSNHLNSHNSQQQHHQNSETNNSNPLANFGFNGFPNDLLQNDLQLSSNSSDDDSD
uniref:Ell-associated factor Eaf n=1 Tax=Musca domestica TaxID=7370 RepID=A0A1I8NB90_MUSDO